VSRHIHTSMNKPYLFAITLSILLLFGFAPFASPGDVWAAPLAAQSCDNSEGVYLYEHKNYEGNCIRLTADQGDLSLDGFNNVASSIRIVGDWTAVLFVDQNFAGDSSTFTRDDADLSNNSVGENTASSVRIYRGDLPPENRCDGSEGVYLYERTSYEGRCVRVTTDQSDLSDLGFNNVASSLRIVGNWTAILYVDQNFGGASSSFIENDADLSNDPIGNGRASAVRVQQGGLPTAPPCDGNEGVYLYEHPDYQGRCIKLTESVGDLRIYAFDDTVSSVRVVGDWTVTLYSDLDGTGVSSTFTQSDPNVIDDGIGDNQATSVGIQRGHTPPPDAYSCEGEGVYLYEHPDYQGRCVKLTESVGDLRVLDFDDSVSSVRVVGDWTVVLFSDLYGAGVSSTFNQDDPNVADDAIGDNQATSVSVQ